MLTWTQAVGFKLNLFFYQTNPGLEIYQVILLSALGGFIVGIALMLKPYFKTRRLLKRERQEKKQAEEEFTLRLARVDLMARYLTRPTIQIRGRRPKKKSEAELTCLIRKKYSPKMAELNAIFVQVAPRRNHPAFPDIGPAVSNDYHRLHVHLFDREAPDRGHAFPLPFAHCPAHNCRRSFGGTVAKNDLSGFFKRIRPALAPRIVDREDEIGLGCGGRVFFQ